MYRKILSGFLLLFCLNISYVASADEAVENQTTTQNTVQVEEAGENDFFTLAISNLPQLNTDDSNIGFKSLTKGIYIDNEDIIANFVIGFVGTENLPDWAISLLASVGFTKTIPQYFIFKYLLANMVYVYIPVALLAGLSLMWSALMNLASPKEPEPQIWSLRAKKLIAVLAAPYLHKPLLISLVLSILLVTAFANKFQTVQNVNTAEKIFSTVPSEQDKYIAANNSTNYLEIALSNMKTRQALLSYGAVNLGDRDAFFSNIFGQTVEEALTESNKFQALRIEPINTTKINLDATTKLANIVNVINLSTSVNIYKSDDGYSTDERKNLGYPANIGTVEFNTSAENFEGLSHTSLNDGTLGYQMQAVVKNAAENNGDIMVSNSEKAFEILLPLYLSGNLSTSTLFADSASYPQLDALRKSVNAAAKKLAKESVALVKIDEIGNMPAEARLQLSGLSSAAVMAGIQGADGSGKQTRKILAYFNKIAESKINQDCTERWSTYKTNKVNVEKINAARDQDAKKFFQKDMKAQDYVAWACAWVKDSDATVIALGSEKPEDELQFKAEAMARKAAWDFVALSALEGVKQNANEDKTYQNALASATLRNMKLGLIGYPLDYLNQSRIQDSINRRNNTISSSVYVRYLGPRVEENTYVNTEIVFNTKDLDGESDEAKSLYGKFWTVNLKGIIAQASIDLSALTPENESSINAQLSVAMKNMVMEMTGTSWDSLAPAFGGDPNLSTHEAAKACNANPVPCDQRGTQSIPTTVVNAGVEAYTYGFKVILWNSAFKALSVGADALKDVSSDVGESISVVLGDKGGVKGKAVGKFIGHLGKSVKIFSDLIVAVTDTLTPIAFFMITLGFFLAFVLPMMAVFYAFVSLIKLFTSIPFYQFFFAPLYYFGMIKASNHAEFDRNRKAFVDGYISLVLAVPSLMFSLIIYVAITENLKMATLLRWILGSEAGGLIGMMISGLIALGSLVFILINVLKEVTHGREAFLNKFNYQENSDREVEQMSNKLSDQRIMNLVHGAKNAIDTATYEKKREVKESLRDKAYQRNARQTFAQKSGNTQGMGSGSD